MLHHCHDAKWKLPSQLEGAEAEQRDSLTGGRDGGEGASMSLGSVSLSNMKRFQYKNIISALSSSFD